MSQKLLLFSLVAVLMVGLSPGLCAVDSGAMNNPVENRTGIVLQPREGVSPDSPRTPSSVQIEAYYDDELVSVCSSIQNAGNVVLIELCNHCEDIMSLSEISGSGFSIVPISGISGEWIVTYYLPNGEVYEGSFHVN